MSAKKRNSHRLALIGVAAAVVGGLAAYAKMQGNRVPEAEMRSERLPQHQPVDKRQPPQTKVEKAKDEVEIVRVDYQSEDYKVERDKRKLEAGQSPYLVAVNASLAHVTAVPAGAVATSAKLDGSVLKLDFATPFRKTYGTAEEGEILNTITEALKQFGEVKSVLITEGGQPIESLGSVELTEPLEVPH
ncbi:MAG: GerMN domain-containing protein [Chthonomonas sp.]|nr:GerMN domain-containing protein [Chthonomonas sp.]